MQSYTTRRSAASDFMSPEKKVQKNMTGRRGRIDLMTLTYTGSRTKLSDTIADIEIYSEHNLIKDCSNLHYLNIGEMDGLDEKESERRQEEKTALEKGNRKRRCLSLKKTMKRMWKQSPLLSVTPWNRLVT